jgi:hypothetical protein
MTYQMTHFLRVALRVDDDFALNWNNGHRDQVVFKGIAGLALSLWNESLVLGLDLEQLRERPLKMNTGVEFNYRPQFMRIGTNTGIGNLVARVGLDDFFLENKGFSNEFQRQMNLTYGFGLGFLIEGVRLQADYSYGSYRISNHNRFGLSVYL